MGSILSFLYLDISVSQYIYCTKQRTTSLFLIVNKQLCYSRQNNNFSIKKIIIFQNLLLLERLSAEVNQKCLHWKLFHIYNNQFTGNHRMRCPSVTCKPVVIKLAMTYFYAVRSRRFFTLIDLSWWFTRIKCCNLKIEISLRSD